MIAKDQIKAAKRADLPGVLQSMGVDLVTEGHGYHLSKRQAMYPFMVKHLGLDPQGVQDQKTGTFDESKTVLETPARMRVFDEENPLPKHALKPGSRVAF